MEERLPSPYLEVEILLRPSIILSLDPTELDKGIDAGYGCEDPPVLLFFRDSGQQGAQSFLSNDRVFWGRRQLLR